VIQHRTTFDVSGENGELKREALRIWNEYQLHGQGITYELQGYLTVDRLLPARKVDEHMLADRFYKQAVKDKR
jgi:hypothetical protein